MESNNFESKLLGIQNSRSGSRVYVVAEFGSKIRSWLSILYGVYKNGSIVGIQNIHVQVSMQNALLSLDQEMYSDSADPSQSWMLFHSMKSILNHNSGSTLPIGMLTWNSLFRMSEICTSILFRFYSPTITNRYFSFFVIADSLPQ